MEVQLQSFITLALDGLRGQIHVRPLYAGSKGPVFIEEKDV
jgi:hypothetical protein